ncbi:hypothetical protein Pen01_55760 [Phytomonospora endophytica]|nr:hypothetical protein Pen01_55760 [Phytomonospora endophytica]
MITWEDPPLIGVIRVKTAFAKDYEIRGHSPDRVEVARVSSLGRHATFVAVITNANGGVPGWIFDGGAYPLGEDEQHAILRELKFLMETRFLCPPCGTPSPMSGHHRAMPTHAISRSRSRHCGHGTG